MVEISIAEDFTRYPGGRYRRHGRGSGEEFRDDFLLPLLRVGEHVTVNLDGTSGYPASFVEEAFGGLVRAGIPLTSLKDQLLLQAKDPIYQVYVEQAWQYMHDAKPEAG